MPLLCHSIINLDRQVKMPAGGHARGKNINLKLQGTLEVDISILFGS